MKTPLLSLAFIFIASIILDYYLVKKWRKYKQLVEENELLKNPSRNIDLLKTAFLGDQYSNVLATIHLSIRKLSQLPVIYILGLIAAGIILLKSSIWAGGIVCVVLAMAGFATNTTAGDGDLANNSFPGEENQIKQALLNKTAKLLLWILVVVFLSFTIYATASGDKSPVLERAGSATWAGSIIIGLAIHWSQFAHLKNSFLTQIKNNYQVVVLVTLIIILGFLLRSFLLSEHPYPWSGDEASIGIEARHIIDGAKSNLFETGWATQPNWSFLPTAMAIKIFGDNVVAVRAPSVAAGTLAILFTYLAAREMFNSTIAAISSVFLATYPYHIHFSRIGVNNIMDSLMSPLVFWLIAQSVKKGDIRLCYLAGVFGGLCAYTYAGTKLVPIIGIVILLLFLYNKQNIFLNRAKYILFFITAMAISAAPQIASLMQDKKLLLGRLGQEGILFNGWLTEEIVLSGKPAIEILWNQLTVTFLAFIALPVRGIFYNTPKPYLTIVGSIFFMFGITFSWIRRSKPEYSSLLIWYWAVLIIGGALTMYPPASQRMLMTTPAVAIFIGIGIYQALKYFAHHMALSGTKLRFIAFAIIAFLSIQNIYFYMFEFKRNFYFQDATSEFAMEAGSMVKNLGDEYQVFIVGVPVVFLDFPTFEYLAPNNQIMTLNDKSIAELHLIKSQKYVFFAIPENHTLLEKIMERYKGGQNGTFTRRIREQSILFEYYILGANN